MNDRPEASSTSGHTGWRPEGGRFEIPDGPCYRFQDPSGNPPAILEFKRPGALEQAHEDEAKPHALR